MGAYRVVIDRTAEKELARLPDDVLRLLAKRIAALADDPRPHGCQKLAGREAYRIRQGDYRAVFAIDDAARLVTLVRVAHRSDVYRD